MTTYEESRTLSGHQLPVYYCERLSASEAKWERAKSEFVRLRRSYTKGLEPGTVEYAIADYNGSQNRQVKAAIGDCAFYAQEVQTYAALIQSLLNMKELSR